MNPEILKTAIQRKNWLPLWRVLQEEPNPYQAKIDALLLFLNWTERPVRVTEGFHHYWIECDFISGPLIIDWNVYVYKTQIKNHQEEPFPLKLFAAVRAPSVKTGEKIFVLDKKLYLRDLQEQGLYATRQRSITWTITTAIPEFLKEGLLW